MADDITLYHSDDIKTFFAFFVLLVSASACIDLLITIIFTTSIRLNCQLYTYLAPLVIQIALTTGHQISNYLAMFNERTCHLVETGDNPALMHRRRREATVKSRKHAANAEYTSS